MKIHIKLILCFFITITLTNCSSLKQLLSFSKCEFRIISVQKIVLAGVNLNEKTTKNDFNLADLGIFSQYAIRGTIPLNLILNLEVKNPNAQTASVIKLEWIAYLDDHEILTGLIDQRIEIPGNNGTQNIPLSIQCDLAKILTSSSASSIANLALNLMEVGQTTSKLTVKIKPTINVSSYALTYPGYFTVTNEFSSGT